jgi:hypothetical protein
VVCLLALKEKNQQLQHTISPPYLALTEEGESEREIKIVVMSAKKRDASMQQAIK